MANQNPYAFTDFGQEAQEIEQRRRYAEMLRQQGMAPIEQQTAGGYVVPVSPLQGLGKMAQVYFGKKGSEQADERQKALANRYQADLADVLRRGTSAASGTPEYSFGATAGDDEGNPNLRPAQAAKFWGRPRWPARAILTCAPPKHRTRCRRLRSLWGIRQRRRWVWALHSRQCQMSAERR